MTIKRAFLRVFAKIMVFCVAMTGAFYTARADDLCRNLFDNTGFPKTGTLTQSYFPEFAPTTGNIIPRIELEAGVTYTLSLDVESSVVPFDLSVGCGNGAFSKDIMRKTNLQNGRAYITFTPTAADLNSGKYFAFRVPRYDSRQNYTYSVSNVQLEKGSTATSYVPYNPLCATCDGTVVVENGESRCIPPIKIATTKYSNAQFTPVVNALNTAVDTIKDVVANTITQTAAIAQIASDKQTRPSSGCPTGKTCLLVEDMNGEPHWYEIIEEYIPPEPEGPAPTPVEP